MPLARTAETRKVFSRICLRATRECGPMEAPRERYTHTFFTQGGTYMSNRTTSPATQTAQTGQSSMMMTGGHGGTMTIPHEKIAMRAYQKWCQRGCKDGT